MKRSKLEAARKDRGLSRSDLAKAIQWSAVAIGRWERGEADPQQAAIVALCTFFGKDPAALDLASELSEDEMRRIEKILEKRFIGRRETLEQLLALPAFATVDFSLLSKPLVSPDASLDQCNAVINGCWQLMRGDQLGVVGGMIAANMPVLQAIATHSSEFQEDAALLAVRAKIMQIILATCREDYIGRSLLCREAVQFAELSGNSLALTSALYWQADTYVYCYRQPARAIPLLERGLARIDSNSLQNKSAFCANMAIAHAQDGKETLAQDYLEQAGNALVLGPRGLFDCNLSLSGLYRDEGKMFLALTHHFPEKNYAQNAYEAFSKSLDYKPGKETSRSQVYTHKADAARLMGDLSAFSEALLKGTTIALKLDSKKHKKDAQSVLANAQSSWKHERIYQGLAQMF